MKVHYVSVSSDMLKHSVQVVIIHGRGGSSKKWMDLKSPHQIALMGYEAIIPDLPGFYYLVTIHI